MQDELIRVTPNPELAKNILRQVEMRLEVAHTMDPSRHATLIIEAYYEIIKELMTAVLALDGYKTLSHVALIEYVRKNHTTIFTEYEIRTMDELRKVRNRIAYEGFTLTQDYHDRKEPIAQSIINKLKVTANDKLQRSI